jgi:acyl-CoA reductase-like NAD-dependent aldehyde dehydrogenase
MVRCISPVDGSVYVERPYASAGEVETAVARAVAAQRAWRETPLAKRAERCGALVEAFKADTPRHAEELARQMGRPIRYGAGEVRGFEERARTMIRLAQDALADIALPEKEGFTRFIRREPVGVLLTVAP